MTLITINGITLSLNKNECREALRIKDIINPPWPNPLYAQRAADAWLLHPACLHAATLARRKAAVRALGLIDTKGAHEADIK